MHVHPLAHGRLGARANRGAQLLRLTERCVVALAASALVATFLFLLAHVNEVVVAARSQAVAPEVYYSNCAAARAAGVAPIYAGQPGYRPGLDADRDGIACKPFRNLKRE